MIINKVVISNNILISFNENDKPVDIFDISKIRIGQIVKAKVEKVLPDLEACFVQLEGIDEKGFIDFNSIDPDYFIIRHSNNKLVCQADEFYVQITREKKFNKPYTCSFVKEYLDLGNYPFVNYYLSNYCSLDTEVITDMCFIKEIIESARLYNDEKISLAHLYNFDKIINNTLSTRVYLKDSADIVIQPTEGLTVIDVNYGKKASNKDCHSININAALEIASQLRLRNISGIIIIDFLKDSNKNHLDEIKNILRDNTHDDYCQVDVYDFTKLGLLEITRSRKLSPLYEYFKK